LQLHRFLLGLTCVALATPARADVVINEIRAAASERLLQWDSNGVAQVGTGMRWYQPPFADTTWPSGPGPFGFGTLTNAPPPYATRLEAAMRYLSPTVYLRKSFVVSAADALRTDSLELVVGYNDGFVAYLNGVEIARRNAGPPKKFIHHDQPAYNREVFSGTAPILPTVLNETITIPQTTPLLVEGANVLAVHALNASAADATFYFKADLRMTGTPAVDFVAAGDAWKYFVGVVEPSGQLYDPALLASGKLNVGWGTLNYDDLEWSSGPGPIGAGSPGVALGTNLTALIINITPSLFARKVFTVTANEASDTQPLQLVVRYDDSFVAYINGVEVARRNIGVPNTFTPRTAVADVESNTTVTLSIDPPATLLVPGSNVLAVQVHNYTFSNADLLLQADLRTTGAAGRTLVANNTVWKYLVGTVEPVGAPGEEEEESPEGPESDVDWIELFNNGTEAVSLDGWSLTDDPDERDKWIFPDITLAPGGYLVVVCDGHDIRSIAGGFAHTNFELSAGGEYLGLYDQTGAVVQQFNPTYPRQLPFHSYARGGDGTWKYSDAPSPGTANGGAFSDGIVAAPTVSNPGRFYAGSVSVLLSCATPGATIRYTLDGSEPTSSSSLAGAALNFSSTSRVLRARAFAPGMVPSDIITHTYLINQSAARQGLPAVCLAGDEPRTFYRPFGIMAIVPNTSSAYTGSIWNQFIGNTSGNLTSPTVPPDPSAYHAPMQSGLPAERPVSLEILNTGATPDLRTGAGVRLAGSPFSRPRYVLTAQNSTTPNAGTWSASATQKPQLNLFFRNDYGAKPLNYPLVPGSNVASYENIRLRAGKNDISNPFIRDEYVRRLFLNMGHVGVRGEFVNLYINSFFKGYFNITERPREPFFQQARGTNARFDVRNITVMADGDVLAYNELINYARTRTMVAPGDYDGLKARLDVVNLVDYLLLNVVAATADWPQNNYVMDRARSASGLYRFTVWDAEGGFGGFSRNPPYKSFTDLNTGSPTSESVPAKLFHTRLKANAEYRLLFADRIQKHMFNDGVLTDANQTALYNQLKNRIAPMITEVTGGAFRDFLPLWLNGMGDTTRYTLSGGTTGSLVNSPSRRRVLFDGYTDDTSGGVAVVGAFVSEGLWPATTAPTFSKFGGAVAQNFAVDISNPNAAGTIFYTIDGADPRAVGGAAAGIAYAGTLNIAQSTQLKARVRNTNGEWSPLTEALFTVAQTPRLLVTEVMYHPPDIGTVNGDEFEFVEIKNAGAVPVNLNGVSLRGAVEFVFPNATILGANEFVILVKNPAQFAAKYPGKTVGGTYAGTLSNRGAQIVLHDLGGAPIFTMNYADTPPWPASADGLGNSLVPLDPNNNNDPSDAANWRASSQAGGSPGADDPFAPKVFINELLTNPAAGEAQAIELVNEGPDPVDVSHWWLSDTSALPQKFQIPAPTTIPRGAFLVFAENQFNPAPGQGQSFAFNKQGGQAVLSSGAANGQLTGYVHSYTFGASARGISFGRYRDVVLLDHFVAQRATTFGAANAGPRIGPVVISEIMYHAGPGESDYIELRNISGAPVALFDPSHPANTWRVRGASFNFPSGVTLQPREIVVLSALPSSTFRAQHHVPASVAIFQYGGNLDDDSETLALQMPAEPVAGEGVGDIDVDVVTYGDAGGWPVAPDGHGPALERIQLNGFGDDRTNWRASLSQNGSPGTLPDLNFDAWQAAYFTSTQIADPNVSGRNADPDRDGLSNFLEHAHGLDPLQPDAGDALQITLENDGAAGPFLTLRYRRNPGAIGFQFHVDTAGDLPQWIPDAAVPVGSLVINSDGTETRTLRDTATPADAEKRFIRLRTVEAP
jgi:hypothetical protein